MPVASPTRFTSTSSNLTGSYRSTLSSSSSLDKPYYRSSGGTYVSSTLRNSYGDRTTEYRTRYSDVDGNRERKSSVVEYGRSSRAPSVTDSDSGISSKYRSERSESRSRDLSTSRSESSKTASEPIQRNKRFVSSAALAMSTAELYDKYSPANYIPLTQRIQQQANNYGEISRSKSISNDIGRPPVADSRTLRKARNSAATITERPEGRRYKEITLTPGYSKRNSMSNGVKDTNGNEVPSVSEIRKRFDSKMTVTKLPANDLRYTKASVEHYLNQLKDCKNGPSGYTKLSKEEKPVPIHLPHVEKNGTHKWESGSNSSRSNSNSDISISKTMSEPVSLSKPVVERNGTMTTSLTAKLPSDRLASIKSQLDPNNPIGKILEKSTVITVENGDSEYKKRGSIDISKSKELLKSEIEKQVKALKHTSNFASYIQISQPVASGASPPKTKENNCEEENQINNGVKSEGKSKTSIKYIDADDKAILDNDIESPSGTGFENKTFEHENFLKKRTERNENRVEDEAKSMETSTESTISEPTEDSSPETPSARRRLLDKDFDKDMREENKMELAGGKSSGTLRRSNDRESIAEAREPRSEKSSQTSGLNGLRNIGNTCFMNSVMQCLSNTRPLLEYVIGDKHNADANTTLSCMRGALIAAFASVIKELWRSGERDSVVNTTTFKSQVQRFAPRFMGYSQQDAQVQRFAPRFMGYSQQDAQVSARDLRGDCVSFASVIKELWRSGERDSVVNTTTFKSQVQRFAPRFMGYSQQDAQVSARDLRVDCVSFASVIKELWRSGERDSVVNTTTFKSQVQRFAPRFMGYSQQDAQVSARDLRGDCVSFASVIKELWRSGERDSVVNTTTFKSQVQRFAPRFMGYSQQDAQEFLRYLLEGLHEDVNRVTVKPKPILTEIDDNLSDSAKAAEAWSRYCRLEESRVSDIFVGQLKSTLRCTHCNHDSVTFDPFWDLSLPIPSRTGNLKIQQCLQHFTKEEEMDGDEKPTCSKCGVRRKCLKWFTVQKFPQVLVLHLKRFSPTERFRGKLNVLVEFPLNGLDMSPYAATRGSQSVTYNLYAVSNHSGTTYSGHYTAYCKHPYTGDWHEYNDSRVSSIKPRDVVSPEAYVLFYERT